jgi:two-component system OmpR family sensor kinase
MTGRAMRGLRFRLTASYAIFFTLLIAASSLLFRQFLVISLDSQTRETLEQEWGALKGYLRIEHGRPHWYVDFADPDEAGIGARLRQVYILAETNGTIKQESPEFRLLGLDTANAIQQASSNAEHWIIKSNSKNVPYLIRKGLITDEAVNARYYVAIGRSLTNNQNLLRRFNWLAAGLIPLMVLGGSFVGWVLAGRGLSPVLEVAKTAQRISGSNLSLRIPPRGAGDELDFLIETFNQMIERLEASFVQVRQFSTDVSHELRTPITILRGQLEVALMTADTKEQYRDAIVDSLGDIERLSRIVRALLLLSQAETGQVVLTRTQFDASELVRELGEQFQLPAESASVTLTIQTPSTCEADLDRIQIERMLSNLLSNALKFTAPKGNVALELLCAPDEVKFRVSDTGRGINAEHLPHIFDRFYRVTSPEAATTEKGLGLGLSFVAWIVKAHGGTVDVESTVGTGTTFLIRLPCQPVVAAETFRNEESLTG